MTVLDLLAEVLFCTDVQPSEHPTPEREHTAIRAWLAAHSTADCACRMAQAYGYDMETAAARMKWCRCEITRTYGIKDAA